MIIEKDPSIHDVVRIAGDVDGPRALFFSGIHGNEVSGVHAIEKLLFDFFGGTRGLKRGTLFRSRKRGGAWGPSNATSCST